MGRLKEWFKIHWFSTTIILVSLILSGLSVYYAWTFSKGTKDIGEKRAIFQLAITAIAASVGIGTIINSARSASISAESMKLTKEKDLREQSSHLVPVSPTGEFYLSMPNHKSDKEHFNFSDTSIGRHMLISNAKKNKESMYGFGDIGEKKVKLMNVGKGSCINLEYFFAIDNLSEFTDYYYSSESSDIESSDIESSYGLQYSFKAFYNEDESRNALEIFIDDITMQRSLESVGMTEHDAKEFSDYAMVIEELSHGKFIDFIKPQSEIDLPIPAGFMILCKQYFNAKNKFFNDGIKHNSKEDSAQISSPVAPVGRIFLSYHDESLIRLGELSAEKKTNFEYAITPKIRENANILLDVPFYLEIKPIDPTIK